jgi:hypothetical protein
MRIYILECARKTVKKNGIKGQRTYREVRKMAETGLNAEEISAKVQIPKNTVKRYLRHRTGRHPTIPAGTQIHLPEAARRWALKAAAKEQNPYFQAEILYQVLKETK